MRKYDSYKDSGINWVQEIPNHWGKNKFKFLFNEKKSTPNPTLNSGSISFGEVIYKDDESITESTKLSYQEVLEGEFLINPLNLNYDLKSLRISRSKINVVVSQGYIVLLLVSKDNPEYFKFLLRDFDIRHLKSLGSGVRQTISFTHLLSEELPLPPLSEQQQIVSYLDTKTSQIDTLIEKTKLKIQLLKENRTSLINEVVTKGLNPNVEMKDSGVEWIGEIPSHFQLISIKHLVTTKVTDGPHLTPIFQDTGIPFLSVEGVVGNQIDFKKVRGFISIEDHLEFSKKCKPKRNDVLLVKSGSTTGKSTIVETDLEFNIWSPLCIVRSNETKILPKFTFQTFQSGYFKLLIENNWSYGTQPNIGMGVIENLRIVVPPIFEQNEIVSYLNEHTQLFDKTISVEERRIDTLIEYRQSLISEVVTGKRKVVD
jgi:type I restriction enzyme S subunit